MEYKQLPLVRKCKWSIVTFPSLFKRAPFDYCLDLVVVRAFQSRGLPQGYNGKTRFFVEYMEYKQLPLVRKSK